MTAHTPGPWYARPGSQSIHIWTTSNPADIKSAHHIAGLALDNHVPNDQVQANAALIAAAPELLTALEALIADLAETHAEEKDADHYGDDPDSCSYCRDITTAYAAIAKAKGA